MTTHRNVLSIRIYLNTFLGEELNEKDLKWEQRVAKKYWDKLFTEYAICDLTYFKSE